MKYIRRPQEIEAVQYRYGCDNVRALLGPALIKETTARNTGTTAHIDDGIGEITASTGDWIIKAFGYIHIMSDEQFRREYMPRNGP